MPEFTRETAEDAVLKMAVEGNCGDLSTGICEALDISFEHFLRFAQLDEAGQKIVVQGLATALITKEFK